MPLAPLPTPGAPPGTTAAHAWRPPRAGSAAWWGTKVRQFRRHLFARVRAEERADLQTWLSPRQLALFDRMHLADRRHGLDVVATLRATGATERDLLLAGLLHDAGKGAVGVTPRVVWSLGEALGGWVVAIASRRATLARDLIVLREHAERSATLAEEAGCPPRTVLLIRDQSSPTDSAAGRLLLYADERN